MSLGTPACDGKSLQLVGMVIGLPPVGRQVKQVNLTQLPWLI